VVGDQRTVRGRRSENCVWWEIRDLCVVGDQRTVRGRRSENCAW